MSSNNSYSQTSKVVFLLSYLAGLAILLLMTSTSNLLNKVDVVGGAVNSESASNVIPLRDVEDGDVEEEDQSNGESNNDDISADYLLSPSTDAESKDVNSEAESSGTESTEDADFANAKFDPAPRTTSIPYNHIDVNTRYFLYSPSGGLSNQLQELGFAIEISRILNRTLCVPMIGRHSSGWRSHESLPYMDLFPTDRILDFDRILDKIPAIPLNISVEHFAALFAKVQGTNRIRLVYHPERENWHKDELVRNLGSEKRKLVYLRGAEMWHPWFPPSYMLAVRKHIRFATSLRQRAIDIVKRMFPDGRFNAMHIRLADYSDRWGTFQERSKQILMKPLTERFGANREKMDKTIPLYLASDEPNNGGFVELKKTFKVVTVSDIPKDLLEDYRSLFPKSRIRYDMMGVLDQLICAQAIFFSGTGWSTFSENINFIKSSKKKMFPELVGGDASAATSQQPSS